MDTGASVLPGKNFIVIVSEGDEMIIEETYDCYQLRIEAGDEVFDIYQRDGEWIEIDKKQAAQLVEVLQKWLAGEEME